MDIQANSVFRMLLEQAKSELAHSEPDDRGRTLVAFADFLASDASSESAVELREALGKSQLTPWDEAWVLPELGRATLTALNSWQQMALSLLNRLHESEAIETDAFRDLSNRLAEACDNLKRQSYANR